MKDADLQAVIGPDFNRLFAGIPTPEAVMPYVTIPADPPPENDPGLVDVNEHTMPTDLNAWRDGVKKAKAARNATPRTPEPPEAA